MAVKPEPEPRTVRARLLRWYRRNRRDLPWRATRDPYPVWVSEIMLQQTRVEAVLPYYERFLTRFPTLQHLAGASEQEVLKVWSGLGYYRRARRLHRAARSILDEHGGRFPEDRRSVLALPGIGSYTAGAILSICFDRNEPVVDGNVIRVLARLHGLRGDPNRADLRKLLWERAGELVRGNAPGDVNQAMMELGATVCLPGRAARCSSCPLARDCVARKQDIVARLPALPPRRAPVEEHWVVLLARRRGRKLFWQRRRTSLMDGFWELPGAVLKRPGCGPSELVRSGAELLRDGLGLSGTVRAKELTYQQGISGRRVVQHVLPADIDIRKRRSPRARWLSRSEWQQRPLTTATRRILERLQ